ncbi:MAG: polymer-forming cytoskeletal protein [Rhizomicrobium sp.]|nr:polymer-forming cytoskeletal protein [Rhizomicrobium sp.]
MSSIFTRNEPSQGDKTEPQKSESAASLDQAKRPSPAMAQASAQVITPPAPPPTTQPAKGVSVISRALKITGQLESSEDIQIEGEVEGDVRAATVRVGAGAKVRGTVSGDEVELSGTVEGKIEARKVVLTSTAHMSGDIIHKDVSIQSGAYINGHLKPEYSKPEQPG